jgi:hypothetical protein
MITEFRCGMCRHKVPIDGIDVEKEPCVIFCPRCGTATAFCPREDGRGFSIPGEAPPRSVTAAP